VSQADIDAIVSLGEGNATTRFHYQSGCWISHGVAACWAREETLNNFR